MVLVTGERQRRLPGGSGAGPERSGRRMSSRPGMSRHAGRHEPAAARRPVHGDRGGGRDQGGTGRDQHDLPARHAAGHDQAGDGRRAAGDRRRARAEVIGLVQERVERELADALDGPSGVAALLDEVVARRLDPRDAADRLLARVGPGRAGRR